MKSTKTFSMSSFINGVRGYLRINPAVYLSSPIKKIQTYFRQTAQKIFFSKIRKNSRDSIKKFTNLIIVSEQAKASGGISIRHYEIQLTNIKYWESIIQNVIIVPYVIFSMFGIFLLPLILQSGISPVLGNVRSIPIIISAADSAVVFFSFIEFLVTSSFMLALKIIPKNLRQIFPVLILITYIVIASALYNYDRSPGSITLSILSALLGQITFLIVLIVFLMILTINKLAFIRFRKFYFPDAVIVDGLIDILSRIDKSPSHWTDVSVRRKILMEIEEVSLCVQHDLYKRLRSGDLMTDTWFEQTTKEIAASLRAKKFWILNPKLDTRFYFAQNITNTLLSIATGDWDAVEKSEPEKISIRQLWGDRIKDTIRVLIVGGVPIALLWLIQNSPLALGKPISDYAIGSAILWALFTTITTFDPLFGAKIDALKEIINLLPILGKKP